MFESPSPVISSCFLQQGQNLIRNVTQLSPCILISFLNFFDFILLIIYLHFKLLNNHLVKELLLYPFLFTLSRSMLVK